MMDMLENNVEEDPFPTNPPPTPTYCLLLENFVGLPPSFPKLDKLTIPYVREVGIKECIDQLAEYFQCTDYKFNMIQFWFLDIITDCLWRAQDEYQFPEQHQKIILEWVLYIFDLIKAPHLNLSRKELFRVFKEAMSIAEDHIASGCSLLSLPQDLFTLNSKTMQCSSAASLHSTTCSAYSTLSDEGSAVKDNSCMVMKLGDHTEVYKLPPKPCPANIFCFDSTPDTVSEKKIIEDANTLSGTDSKQNLPAPTEISSSFSSDHFYEPDSRTPERFRSGSSVAISDSSSQTLVAKSIAGLVSIQSQYYIEPHHCPSEPIISIPSSSDEDEEGDEGTSEIHQLDSRWEKQKEAELFHAWFQYNLWQKHLEDMNNPSLGWKASSESVGVGSSSSSASSKSTKSVELAWKEHLLMHKKSLDNLHKNIFINSCVLMAIKQFVFDYFYETFQFSLIRNAYRYSHNVLAQSLNKKWQVPKLMRDEFRKPKVIKKKKERAPKKEKQPKKDKDSTKTKSKSTPKSEQSKKSEKSAKSKKTKTPKAEPKPKSDKKKSGLELELAKRLKKEEELMEEQRRIDEENKWLMFPLGQATGDDFFRSIFPGWVKPVKTAKAPKKEPKEAKKGADESSKKSGKTKKK